MSLRKNRRKSLWVFLFACLLFAVALFSVVLFGETANGRLYSAIGNPDRRAPRLVGGANYAGGNDGADIVNNGTDIAGNSFVTEAAKTNFIGDNFMNWFYFALIFLAMAIIALVVILVPKRKK